MPHLQISNLNNFILKKINMSVFNKEFVAVLGETGSGKSSLLNAISGLTEYEGKISINKTVLNRSNIKEFRIGYLFQDLYLFPHLTVFENIAFSLRCKKIKTTEIIDQVNSMLNIMDLKHLSDRYPKYLSGGEKQKTALARVLIAKPELLLLDEPFSSVDAVFKDKLLLEMQEYLHKLKITTIYVTHNLEEAYVLADKIAILKDGMLQQFGEKNYVMKHPANINVVNYFGLKNFFKGIVTDLNQAENEIKIKFYNLIISAVYKNNFNIGDEIDFCIWPQDIKIINENRPLREFVKFNHFTGIINRILFHGFFYTLFVKIDNAVFFELKIPSYIYQRLELCLNKKITISLIKSAIHIL